MPDPSRTSAPQSDWDLKRHDREPEPEELGPLLRRIEALERAPGARPWWWNGKTVTFVASLVAALIPLTTFIESTLKSRSDLALARQQQDHAMRMDYMRTALDPSAPEMQRQSRLRLLIAMLSTDDPVRSWAEGELTLVDHAVDELQKKLAESQAVLAQVQSEEVGAKTRIAQLEEQLSRAESPGGGRLGGDDTPPAPVAPAQQRALERDLLKTKAELAAIKVRREALSSEAARASTQLRGDTQQMQLKK